MDTCYCLHFVIVTLLLLGFNEIESIVPVIYLCQLPAFESIVRRFIHLPVVSVIDAGKELVVSVRKDPDNEHIAFVSNRTIYSPNHSTFDIEDAFSSINILNYTSVSSDYFPASSGSSSFNYSENSMDNMIPQVFSPFYNNPYLKDVQAFYAKESPVSPPAPITLQTELLPSKKQTCLPSLSFTNPSQNQTCDLVSPSFSVYTPTPPQIFEIGKSSIKMHLKHHEKQIEDILNYLEELSFHRIEKMEEGHINDMMIIQKDGNELKTELKRVRSQITKLQRRQLAQRDKIAFAHFRISDLEKINEEIQTRYQTGQEDL
ncbi:hypothetical protein Tco_1439571 [Tanacetum coccineum]